MHKNEPEPQTNHVQLIIISGLAGAGKSVVLRALEDANFHCVDNLPSVLLETFYEKFKDRVFPWKRLAIALDSRDLGVSE